ncbi:MAG TPA: cupin domain-containing protein [Saprospiraceae bacterium]|nr:cupin domain-containing protein [Saprospiraceae bacterium]
MKISPEEGLNRLSAERKLFTELYSHGSLSVEIYKPLKEDLQTPHDRDEVYVIIAGHGDFISDGKKHTFKQGDFFFVPAHIEHRFENFSDDFSTWIIFFGPIGGEANTIGSQQSAISNWQ